MPRSPRPRRCPRFPRPRWPRPVPPPGRARECPRWSRRPRATRDIRGNGSGLYVAARTIRLRVTDRPNTFTGVPPGGQFPVVPRWALGRQAPPATVMAIVGPRLDTAALLRTAHRAVPGAHVTLRTD